jgi:hypothetical protein
MPRARGRARRTGPVGAHEQLVARLLGSGDLHRAVSRGGGVYSPASQDGATVSVAVCCRRVHVTPPPVVRDDMMLTRACATLSRALAGQRPRWDDDAKHARMAGDGR